MGGRKSGLPKRPRSRARPEERDQMDFTYSKSEPSLTCTPRHQASGDTKQEANSSTPTNATVGTTNAFWYLPSTSTTFAGPASAAARTPPTGPSSSGENLAIKRTAASPAPAQKPIVKQRPHTPATWSRPIVLTIDGYSAEGHSATTESAAAFTESNSSKIITVAPSSGTDICLGTKKVKIAPYSEKEPMGEREGMEEIVYHAITAQPECASFSLEELRLADYGGRAVKRPEQISRSQLLAYRDSRSFKGPCIKVVVGVKEILPPNEPSTVDTWWIHENLLAQNSTRLAAEFRLHHRTSDSTFSISFPDLTPYAFSLWVDWLYHGRYLPNDATATPETPTIDADVEAWIIGEQLQCAAFKKFAMNRIYDKYTADHHPQPITVRDFMHVFSHAPHDSKLRRLYKNLLRVHFANTKRVLGTTKEWDGVFQTHRDVRMLLLDSMRSEDAKHGLKINSKEFYMDPSHAGDKQAGAKGDAYGKALVPAKRTAQGSLVGLGDAEAGMCDGFEYQSRVDAGAEGLQRSWQVPCRSFLEGRCAFGSRCKFWHGPVAHGR